MARTTSFTMPGGRIPELLTRPDADRIAYRPLSLRLFSDYKCTIFQSRAALVAFLKTQPALVALIKDPVHPTMMLYPNLQRPATQEG